MVERATLELSAPFQVVPGQTPIETVTTPDAATLGKRFNKAAVWVASNSGPGTRIDSQALVIALNTPRLPVQAVFEVFARCSGKEFPAGLVFYPGGHRPRNEILIVHDFPLDGPSTVDLILRSREDAARQTTDITRIWKGEINLPGIPVHRPNAATAPGTQP